LIRAAGATPCGVVIALDRMERGQGELSAVQEVKRDYGLPVVSIAALDDLLDYLQGQAELVQNLQAVQSYRDRYGVKNEQIKIAGGKCCFMRRIQLQRRCQAL
jgi:orotate phosphoribosyltransferase